MAEDEYIRTVPLSTAVACALLEQGVALSELQRAEQREVKVRSCIRSSDSLKVKQTGIVTTLCHVNLSNGKSIFCGALDILLLSTAQPASSNNR
jgi:hypothetical protein